MVERRIVIYTLLQEDSPTVCAESALGLIEVGKKISTRPFLIIRPFEPQIFFDKKGMRFLGSLVLTSANFPQSSAVYADRLKPMGETAREAFIEHFDWVYRLRERRLD